MRSAQRVVHVGARHAEDEEVARVNDRLDVSVQGEPVAVQGEALEVMRIVAGLPDVVQRLGLADPPVHRVLGGLGVLREQEGEGRGPTPTADDADAGDGRGCVGHATKVCRWRGNPYFCGADGCNAHLPHSHLPPL